MNTDKINAAITTQQQEEGLKAYSQAYDAADGMLGSADEWESVARFKSWYSSWCNENGYFSDCDSIKLS